jgi:hypothetical protein
MLVWLQSNITAIGLNDSDTQPNIHTYANKIFITGQDMRRKGHENNTSHTCRPTYNQNVNIREGKLTYTPNQHTNV